MQSRWFQFTIDLTRSYKIQMAQLRNVNCLLLLKDESLARGRVHILVEINVDIFGHFLN